MINFTIITIRQIIPAVRIVEGISGCPFALIGVIVAEGEGVTEFTDVGFTGVHSVGIGAFAEGSHIDGFAADIQRRAEHIAKHYSVVAAQNLVTASNIGFIDKRCFTAMDQGKSIPEKIFGFAIVDRLSNLPIVMIIETCDLLPVFSYAQNFIQPAISIGFITLFDQPPGSIIGIMSYLAICCR